jgi:hypothetical protein
VEEVDERIFLFGGEVGTDTQCLSVGVVRADGDLLGVLHGLKGPILSLGVMHIHGHRLLDDRELLRGDSHSSKLAALQVHS